MKANLLCGNRNLPKHILVEHKHEHWIGIDRGTLILLESGITPQFAVGDFDSISDSERNFIQQQIEINPYNSEKDDTDLALGIDQAVKRGYRNIDVYGATGGRLDHFMGALQILEKPEYTKMNINIKLIDDTNEIQFIQKGQINVTYSEQFPYISFIPVIYPTVISLKGFKYNLQNETLKLGSTLTISNELSQSCGNIEIIEGSVLMIRSKD
ncbi:thiamine diphosphokinase [Staphylococcus saprophyticus]|uniref:thiamine diphosphokinase n=1 Tax=Staphylococcus saprophyticus TaxID=29385 RepID=UPI002DBF7677|nr:thiamine diphosphokinase [Staphylococcus saprophyticus]MEB7675680.1 thiamine diphosphokinase [Staphylococcus saprophyticus]